MLDASSLSVERWFIRQVERQAAVAALRQFACAVQVPRSPVGVDSKVPLI
jgi:hypothetical protein